jgi:hypothetical protein
MAFGFRVAGALAGVCLLIASTGCGNEDLVFPGMALPTPVATTTATCIQSGGSCTLSSDCCSGNCFAPNGVNLQCQ